MEFPQFPVLTNEERQLLHHVGSSLIHDFVYTFILLIFYGVFVILFSASMVLILRRRGFSNRIARIVFCATIFNFLVFTLLAGWTLAAVIISIRRTFIAPVGTTLEDRVPVIDRGFSTSHFVIYGAATFPPLVSDLIAIWRASVLYRDQHWPIVLLVILWIASAAFKITCAALFLTKDSIVYNIPRSQALLITQTRIVLSILTSLVTTLTIGYKLWRHRVLIVKILGLGKRESPVLNVLALLVETGIVYCCLQIICFILGVFLPNTWIPGIVFRGITESFASMYPTIVIVLIETQQSLANFTTLGSLELQLEETSEEAVGPITFAPRASIQNSVSESSNDSSERSCAEGQRPRPNSAP